MNTFFTYTGKVAEPGLQVRIKPESILSWRLIMPGPILSWRLIMKYFSTVSLLLPLIQEGLLSITSESMCI